MRVVNPEDALSSGIVHRQRVTNAMRTMFVRRHTLRHELHPKAATDLGEEAVEIEEPLETPSRRLISLIYHEVIT